MFVLTFHATHQKLAVRSKESIDCLKTTTEFWIFCYSIALFKILCWYTKSAMCMKKSWPKDIVTSINPAEIRFTCTRTHTCINHAAYTRSMCDFMLCIKYCKSTYVYNNNVDKLHQLPLQNVLYITVLWKHCNVLHLLSYCNKLLSVLNFKCSSYKESIENKFMLFVIYDHWHIFKFDCLHGIYV
jgi:hypothetical protein